MLTFHKSSTGKLWRRLSALAAAALLTVTVGAGSAAAQRVDLLGAGATFPAPLVTAMADEYRSKTNGRVTLNYQSIGSGGGIRQFIEQTVMFGMTEAFLSDEVMANIKQRTGGNAFNLPITLADVVPTYNLPGIQKGLVLNGEVLVELFLGKITRWNDPKIAALNPGVRLPVLPVTIVHRSDGSGTTNIWTSYLSRVSPEWANRVGFATSVNWPTGIGGNGNEGVAGVVMNTPGALGYNSLSYALLNDIAFAYVVNASGNLIEPSYAATTAAADIELPTDTRVLFTNTPAPDGYPAAGFAWMLVYENLEKNRAISNRAQAEALLQFLIWAITDGQELSESLGFARLPQAAIDRNFDMIRQIKWQGEKLGAKMLDNR
ncbi:phosphate ABC transporter substrate-binding protein PstS [Desulfurivibrio alkaliphilus]|uniref:Phosphate-binding protein n=1 Tax=Desulfurivibrio alkaliphilus (strain DSM 19089 / UNIQEM U267 / AHT2) TaxID=589865 RepID=D6Z3Y7_DESAT|nr:phosphate ABC transporter substrate-binding protein PstS [Desulfurivibrio alkaliphilus]ADH86262.1 phosphate ABC transporter, periplasmic phosphate-binding protein [Desulfurivibrio alkaliphilus AHT 2]